MPTESLAGTRSVRLPFDSVQLVREGGAWKIHRYLFATTQPRA